MGEDGPEDAPAVVAPVEGSTRASRDANDFEDDVSATDTTLDAELELSNDEVDEVDENQQKAGAARGSAVFDFPEEVELANQSKKRSSSSSSSLSSKSSSREKEKATRSSGGISKGEENQENDVTEAVKETGAKEAIFDNAASKAEEEIADMATDEHSNNMEESKQEMAEDEVEGDDDNVNDNDERAQEDKRSSGGPMPLEVVHPNSPRAARPVNHKSLGKKKDGQQPDRQDNKAAAGHGAAKQGKSRSKKASKYSPATNLRTQKIIREKAEKKRSIEKSSSTESFGSDGPGRGGLSGPTPVAKRTRSGGSRAHAH